MKEVHTGDNYPAAHIAASERYFAETFPDDVETRQSFGGRKVMPDFDVTYGITYSADFEVAAIAMDVHVLNDEGALLEFAQSLDQKEVLVTCLINAIEPIRDYFEELQQSEDDLPEHFGLMLIAELRDNGSDEQSRQFADQIEGICYPVPVNKDVQISSYLFTTVGYEDVESPISVGSLVFATGSEFGDDSGFPPYWSYAEMVTVFPDDEDDPA